VRFKFILPLGLEALLLTFETDTQLLKGKNASGVFKVLQAVLLDGFQLPGLRLYNLELHGGKNMKEVSGMEGFVVRRMIGNVYSDILLVIRYYQIVLMCIIVLCGSAAKRRCFTHNVLFSVGQNAESV